MLDTPQRIRKGEELSAKALNEYFKRHELPQITSITQFPSGFSNLTYCLHSAEGDIVLRRAPFGAQAAGGHNMVENFLFQKESIHTTKTSQNRFTAAQI